MPLPQDIRPVFQDIQDTLIRSDAPWIERSQLDKLKVLWIGRETGTWATLHHWKKGYAAPPHKHLGGAHVFILSGCRSAMARLTPAITSMSRPACCTTRRPRWRTRPISL